MLLSSRSNGTTFSELLNQSPYNSRQIIRKKLNEDTDKLKRITFSKGTVNVRNRCADFIYY